MMRAIYSEQINPEFRGNPFIEALPPRLSKELFVKRFTLSGPSPGEDIKRPAEERLELLEMLNSFFVYMPWHFNVYNTIYSMIKRCYVPRNPADPKYWLFVKSKRRELSEVYKAESPTPAGRTAAALIGSAGLGKTEVTKRTLSLFPQVIAHGGVEGGIEPCLQLTSVHIEADRNGSIKGICDQIFEKADGALGTRYRDIYKRETEPGKVAGVVTICHLHGVGIIVLDEIQELSLQKSGGENGIISFLLHLSNRAGPSVLFVGTPDAPMLKTKSLRYVRRSSGIPEVQPFARGSADWRDFFDELWRYRYTKGGPESTATLEDTMYSLTAGIPDLTIELYKRAQAALIQNEAQENLELLTPALLEEVALAFLSREVQTVEEWDTRPGMGRPADAPTLPRGHRPPRFRPTSAPCKDRQDVEDTPERYKSSGADNKNVCSTLMEIATIGEAAPDEWVNNLRKAGIIKPPMEFHEASL